MELMLRLVLTALYVSLKLVPQHRFYLSEFCFAKLSLLIQFLEVRQQVVSDSSVSNGLIAQFSHHEESHCYQQGQDHQRQDQLPGRRRAKLQNLLHIATRTLQVPNFQPLSSIMHIGVRRSSFPPGQFFLLDAAGWPLGRRFLRSGLGQVQRLRLLRPISRGLSSLLNSP